MKRSLLLIVPAAATIVLTACADGPLSPARTKVNPSSSFLLNLAREVNEGRAGQYCEMVIDDWIAQNEPRVP